MLTDLGSTSWSGPHRLLVAEQLCLQGHGTARTMVCFKPSPHIFQSGSGPPWSGFSAGIPGVTTMVSVALLCSPILALGRKGSIRDVAVLETSVVSRGGSRVLKEGVLILRTEYPRESCERA